MAQVRVELLKAGDSLYVFSRIRKAPRRLKIREVIPHKDTVLIRFTISSEGSITMNKEQVVGADIA